MRFIFYFIFILFSQNAFCQIINIEERRIRGTVDSVHWYGALGFGANVAKVKETVLQLNTDAQLEYKWGRHLALSLTNYNIVKVGEKSFINAGFQHLRYNYKLSKDFRLTYELYGQVQQNQVQLIALRRLWGTGLRYRLWSSKDGQSRLYVGASYLQEYNRYKNMLDVKKFHRISNYVTMTYRPSKTVLFINTTYFQPNFNAVEQLRWSSETDVELRITKKISFKGAFNLNFDATLPKDIPRQTFSLMNGLKWNL